MFGSMPWCWFPWHKLVPRLAQKNPHTTVWIWSMSSHLSCRRRWLLQVCLGKPPMEIGKSRHWTSVFFCREFHRATKAIAQMNADWKVEKAQYAEFNVPTCGKIAVWQLCRERQPFWNSHDGLNLTCLDQCHGVGSHGTSSSQGWRKRIALKSTV